MRNHMAPINFSVTDSKTKISHVLPRQHSIWSVTKSSFSRTKLRSQSQSRKKFIQDKRRHIRRKKSLTFFSRTEVIRLRRQRLVPIRRISLRLNN